MLMFDGICCEVNLLRGQLKHSWLENQIRNINSDDVVTFWKDGDWDDKIETVFPHRLQEAKELAKELVTGFSPSQLIDQLTPFKNISSELRDQFKKAIHDIYLETSNIAVLVEPIRKCVHDLEPEISELRSLWKMPSTQENEILLRACWDRIRTKGMALHDQLEKLPRGIIIP